VELEQSKKRSFVKVDKDIKHSIPCLYARAVFINLCEHRNSITGLCCPNEINIAKEELMSVWKVNKCIKLLVSLKIITINKQWKSNGYIINDKDISYLSHVSHTCDGDDKIDLSPVPHTVDTPSSHVPHTVDTPSSHVPHTVDHMCHTHTNNMNSKKINKKNNKMNILVPLHGTCVLSEDKILNLNSEEKPMQELMTTETKVTSKKVRHDYSKEFEEFWRVYPPRHTDESKIKAYRQWISRIKEGHSAKDMIDGAIRYRALVECTGEIGTSTTKMACTFIGRDEHFILQYTLKANMGVTTNADRKPTNAQDRYNANIRRAKEHLEESLQDQMYKII